MHIIQRGGDRIAGQCADLAEGPFLPTFLWALRCTGTAITPCGMGNDTSVSETLA